MITRKIACYDFGSLDLKTPVNGDFLKGDFYLSLPPLPRCPQAEKILFSLPGALELRLICRSLDQVGEDTPSLLKEECFYFNETEEWMLECRFQMEMKDGFSRDTYFLRLPLSHPKAGEPLGLWFNGTWLRLMCEGEVLNENSGLEQFCAPTAGLCVDPEYRGVQVAPVSEVRRTFRQEISKVSPAFFVPRGWNAWVGDVMSFSHNGVYHIMYLLDRRHHKSRNGKGAHYICHLTTENMVDWYEQEPVAELDAPWQSHGTGTMIYHRGKYYMFFGFHTERHKNLQPLSVPRVDPHTELVERLSYRKILEEGRLPAGATYYVSEDGLHFEPSDVLLHPARNPSVYTDENGKITLYGGSRGDGVFETDSIDHPFKRVRKDLGFIKSPLVRNTTECPAFFNWKGYRYLLMGFTGYFRSLTPGGELVDAVPLGESIYDGLSVPMVAEFGDDRRILAGWVNGPEGWGGVMMQRELVQEAEGKLGTKWVPELLPQGESIPFTGALEPKQSYYLELEVDPSAEKHPEIRLTDGAKTCVLELDLAKSTVQISDAPGIPILPIEEQLKGVDPEIRSVHHTGKKDLPYYARNFILTDQEFPKEPFRVRLALRYSQKMRSTVLDAEFAEKRTLISVRENFFPSGLSLSEGIRVTVFQKIECIEE